MNKGLKEVRFDLYCKNCKHKNKKQTETPCDECLAEPANVDSHKPVKFEERRKDKTSTKE